MIEIARAYVTHQESESIVRRLAGTACPTKDRVGSRAHTSLYGGGVCRPSGRYEPIPSPHNLHVIDWQIRMRLIIETRIRSGTVTKIKYGTRAENEDKENFDSDLLTRIKKLIGIGIGNDIGIEIDIDRDKGRKNPFYVHAGVAAGNHTDKSSIRERFQLAVAPPAPPAHFRARPRRPTLKH
ncbi:hypothetical protein EVAR_56941_1 [Eumeta japonica]|uniref:Uncharacterized protein n=1 Tax=Eumeta variegata TaxID=151549 RepID=A0A4C1YS91_EUMVA|nr:hypothetical protein EVAR_56941_1 [Eumeta japonica]